MRHFLVLVLFSLLSLSVLAGDPLPPLTLNQSSVDVNLNDYLGLLEDPDRELTFARALEQLDAGAFQRLSGVAPNFGFTAAAWWVTFTIHNPSDHVRHLLVRQNYPLIDQLDLWASQPDGNWEHIATGDRLPFTERPLATRDFQFPVVIPANGEQTFILRYHTQGSLNIGLSVMSPDVTVAALTKEYLALGIYYGGFLVLLVYNLLLFIGLREKVFVYYALYVLSYGTYMSVHNGLSFQYLWPGNTWLANQSLVILLSLSLLWATRFAREILSTRQLAPWADRIAGAMELCMWVALVVGPFVPYRWVVVPLSAMTGIICFHLLIMGILTLLRGSIPARYYLTAFSALLLGVMTYMLKTFGLLPHNAFTQNAFQVGALVEMVLLSLAIGSRLNESKLQASIDSLTDLHNRRHFNEQILTEFEKAQRRSQPLTLMVLDIDHFKCFNDNHGHVQGDLALQAVARVLGSAIRKPNICCRYGGEEFAIILPNCPTAAAATLAERLRQLVEEKTRESFGLSVSIGLATLEGSNFQDPDALFVAADEALYRAKEQGRNRVERFDEMAAALGL